MMKQQLCTTQVWYMHVVISHHNISLYVDTTDLQMSRTQVASMAILISNNIWAYDIKCLRTCTPKKIAIDKSKPRMITIVFL